MLAPCGKITCIKGSFLDAHVLHYILGLCMHIRCLMNCLLGIFSRVWTPMSTKLQGFSCFIIRKCLVYWLCILHTLPRMYISLALFKHCTQPPLAYTGATLVMPWSISCFLILACHVYLMLCSTFLRCCIFCLSFISYSSLPLMHLYPYSYHHIFPSFFLTHLSISGKRGEYTREYIGEYSHFYMTLVHIFKRRTSNSSAHS